MAELVVFAGPSACGLDLPRLAGATARLLPPAGRGDVAALIDGSPPGVVVVCDGVFQARPAVSHAELCDALDAGWQVWGVSSIGAIRAHELRREGMRGFGYVHAQFERFADFTDDEVCLLHFPDPPFFPVTEALVNLRHAIEQRRAQLGITRRTEKTIIDSLRRLWFGDRTASAMRRSMLEADLPPAAADTLMAWIAGNRIKTVDLGQLLERRPWRL